MWHFCQHTPILQASQQCKNTYCGSSSCWRHILQATLSLYAPNTVLPALLPTFSGGDQIHMLSLWCPRAGLMKALRQSTNFPPLHSLTHSTNPAPCHTHTLPCTLHGQNTHVQPPAHSCRSLLSPEWTWLHRHPCANTDIPLPAHIVWKCNSSGSEEAKDQILFGSKALSWTVSGNSR